MRAFIAFPLPEEVKKKIGTYLKPLQDRYREVKWVRPENLHITLHFLGDIEEEAGDRISTVLERAAAGQFCIEVNFSGIGYFPPKGVPRVVFTPLTAGAEECADFYRASGRELKTLINLKMKKFIPHITLGRVRKGRRLERNIGEERQDRLEGSFLIDRAVLYKSVLYSTGPSYSELREYIFKQKNEVE